MSTDDAKRAMQREQGRRLRAAREHAGLQSAREGADFVKESYNTYAAHENGNRGIGRAAADYAAKYGVPEEWLLRGKNPPDWAVGEASDTVVVDGNHQLIAWRAYSTLSVEDLADRLGVPVDLVKSWESGHEISSRWLSRLAELFETTSGSILDVDPRTIPRDLLELWRTTAKQQAVLREQIRKLGRTGTDG